MNLVKPPIMTEKKVAANRRNQTLCHVPLTEQARERLRAAHLRHGYFAKAEAGALRTLGEDPAQFQLLLESLWEEFAPTGTVQEGLVIQFARNLWLSQRYDRGQEGEALRRARAAGLGRENRLHGNLMVLKMILECMGGMLQSVQCPYYVASADDVASMKRIDDEGVLYSMGEIAYGLIQQLEAPGTAEDSPEVQQRKVLLRIKEIFGIDSEKDRPQEKQLPAVAPPGTEIHSGLLLSTTEWEQRERTRQLLENILRRQIEICEARCRDMVKESIAGPSPYELAAEISADPNETMLARRIRAANFREFRRVLSLLMKLKRRERPEQAPESASSFHDVDETKGVNENCAASHNFVSATTQTTCAITQDGAPQNGEIRI